MDREAEPAAATPPESASSDHALDLAPVTPVEPIQENQSEPPLYGRRLRQECWSLTETAHELATSRWTLWRAERSDLPGFPELIIVSKRLHWRKSDLERGLRSLTPPL
jgi:hypothetical protein